MKAFIRLFAILFALIFIIVAVISCENGSRKSKDSNDAKGSASTVTTVTTVTPEGTTASRNDSFVATKLPSTTKPYTYYTTLDIPPETVPSTKQTKPPSTRPVISQQTSESSLPSFNWKGDIFYVLGRESSTNSHFTNFEIWREKKDDTLVGEAVWERNEILKNKHNFYVEQELVIDTAKESQIMFNAQDDIYDLIIYTPDNAMRHASSRYLLNLYETKHINTAHIAWNLSVNNDFVIGNSLYFSTNQFLLQDKAMTSALFYNDELAERISKEMGKPLADIPSLALEGKWTLELFNELTKLSEASSTNDASTKRIGLASDSNELFASFFYGSGAALSNNVNGISVLVPPSFDIINKIDQIGNTLFNKNLVQYPESQKSDAAYIFAKGNTLFYSSYLHQMKSNDIHINMRDHIYALPYPKYDTSQESYYSFVSPKASSVFAIPNTVADPDQVGFYLQAISEESVNTTYKAYINSIVYHRHDELETGLVDLILKSQKYDITATLNFGGLYTIISSDIPKFSTNIYKRLYDNKGDTPIVARDDFFKKFDF